MIYKNPSPIIEFFQQQTINGRKTINEFRKKKTEKSITKHSFACEINMNNQRCYKTARK